jgi:phosphoribosyl-AMP cyclohydrolase
MTHAFADPATLTAAEIEAGQVLAPRFDDNGLITAIAVAADTGGVLMLAHMNADALALTLETGQAHYFSRSRNRIWKKGETSGEIQRLIELRVDCDQDALLLLVEQTGRGAACHTGRRSCFYRRVELADGKASLAETGDTPLFDPNEVYGGHHQ